MAEAKILIEGYVSADSGGHSCSTTVLVKDEDLKIVVDPGTVPDQDLIREKLKEEGLNVEDINIIFITHSHTDHYRNIGMFPKAKALDYFGWWEGDVWREASENITENMATERCLKLKNNQNLGPPSALRASAGKPKLRN